jgi:probable rRNA maturation factor
VQREGVVSPVPAIALARAAVAALDAAGAPAPASLGIILSADPELAALNEAHMGARGPTDVLSFPLLPQEAYPPHPRARLGHDGRFPSEGFALPPGQRPHLGDIVVSVERAVDQAAAGRGGQTGDLAWDASDELRLLVVHGTLHICGWDHEEPMEEAAMRALERRLLGDPPIRPSARGRQAPPGPPAPAASSTGAKR